MTEFRCSAAARERGEPLAGTALTSRRWVLIEQRGHWQHSVADTEPITHPLGRALLSAAVAAAGEVFLVRRPGRRALDGDSSWCVIDGPTATMTRGRYADPSDLGPAIDALARLRDGQPLDDPATEVTLVCAHNTRDRCCAVSGRSIAADLATLAPERVWESSHLGGHRFAGTMLMLPAGIHYGNLDIAAARRVLASHDTGRVESAYLRGMTMLAPPAQAAVAATFDRYPAAVRGDVVVGDVEFVGELVWRVSLHGTGVVPRSLMMRVSGEDSEPLRMSCRDDARKSARTYVARLEEAAEAQGLPAGGVDDGTIADRSIEFDR